MLRRRTIRPAMPYCGSIKWLNPLSEERTFQAARPKELVLDRISWSGANNTETRILTRQVMLAA